MVIAWFGEPNIPCALPLLGTDAVEVYFSQNGSWIINKHTYTFMDMVRNLTAMNRLNQIRASNPLLNVRKAHSKQDNIWDKQYAENRRNELEEQFPDLLKRYPSKEEVVEAWKSGIELAKDMGRRAGMGPDDIGELDGGGGGGGGDDDDRDDWFSKPFKFVKFQSMFDDMLSEEAVQSSPSYTEIENEDGCISFEECVQQSVIDDSIDQMLMSVRRL